MKREVGATTVLAALPLVAGAVLLISQWPTDETHALALAHPLYLVAELGLYLLLLMALDRGLKAVGYGLGAFGALATRLGIGFASAGVAYLRAGGPFDVCLYPAIFSLPGVSIAAAGAAAMLILLRDLLPQRPLAAPAPGLRAPQSAKLAFETAVKPGVETQRPSELIFLDESPAADEQPPRAQAKPERIFEGEIELPLSVMLREAAEQIQPTQGQENTAVAIPMAVVGPQLKEGRVVLTAAQLAEFAPQGAVDVSQADQEAEFSLPLDAVVSALPEGTLDLGPPSPPAWRCELEESEQALFSAA